MILLTEYIISEEWIWIMVAGLVIIFLVFRNSFISLQNKFKAQELEYHRFKAEAAIKSQKWALEELEKYKENEFSAIKRQIEENATDAALILLEEWKQKNTSWIREDAINRSYAVNLGKITEHLLPFHEQFPFNPKDVRFMGSPIDLIVFDGVNEKKKEITIYFVEVKTGASILSEIQTKIKSSVAHKRIEWVEINPANF